MRVVTGLLCAVGVLGVVTGILAVRHSTIGHAREGDGGWARVECAGLSFLSRDKLTPLKSNALPANVDELRAFSCASAKLTVFASETLYRPKAAPAVHAAASPALSALSRLIGANKPTEIQIAPTTLDGVDGVRFTATLLRSGRPWKAEGRILAHRTTFWTLQVAYDPRDQSSATNAARILASVQLAPGAFATR